MGWLNVMKKIFFLSLALIVFSSSNAHAGIRTCQELQAVIAKKAYDKQLTDTPLEWPKSITQNAAQLASTVEKELMPLYRSAEHGKFKTQDGISVAFSYFKALPEAEIGLTPKGTLVISHGLGESRPQWLDQIKTFIKEGYNVFIYEHRGQAHSDRPLPNYQKVHINRFSDYDSDMHEFVQKVVRPRSQGPVYGIGFSLGGLVATFNHLKNPEDFSALVAISPAYQIRTREVPSSLVRAAVDLMVLLGKESEYSFFQKDFSEDKLELLRQHTHDSDRWQAFLTVLKTYPMTVPGGLTHGWLARMLGANKQIQKSFHQIQKPTLVIGAGQDGLVRTDVIKALASKHPWISTYFDDAAFHSIIHDSDSIRNPAMTEVLRYLIHPERLDSQAGAPSAQSLMAYSESLLTRQEQAFAYYTAKEAELRWKVTHPTEAIPSQLKELSQRAGEALSASSEGQRGLFDFLTYRRQQELQKLYSPHFLNQLDAQH